MIETRLLQYFLAVANERSMTRAAERLHVTQPTLSKQIKELEDTLGKKLLIRDRRGLRLTEEGSYLKVQAYEMLSMLEKTESYFKDEGTGLVGDVYIGCGEFRSAYPVIELMNEIREEHPGVCFHFFSGLSNEITSRLASGLLDAGFVIDSDPLPYIEYEKLPFFENWGIVVRRDSPLAYRESVTAGDLEDVPLILPERLDVRRQVLRSLFESGKPPKAAATYTLVYNATLMVEAGLGVALSIGDLVPVDVGSPFAFVPISPEVRSELYLATRNGQLYSKAAKLFLERLRELVANYPREVR